MAYRNTVRYYEKTKRRHYRKRQEICFAYLTSDIDKIRFICDVDESLESEEIDYYLSFLGEILDPVYKLRLCKWKKYYLGIYVDFAHFKPGPDIFQFRRLLLHVTALRYLQEFPEIVKLLYQNKKDTIEENFIQFQLCHGEFHFNLERKKYDNLMGHGLIYSAGWRNANIPTITLEKFRENIKLNLSRVNRYFE